MRRTLRRTLTARTGPERHAAKAACQPRRGLSQTVWIRFKAGSTFAQVACPWTDTAFYYC